jgi:hypothetical protein
MPKTKKNFARVTLWTEHIKLQTEGHTVAVVTQIFDHLTPGQKKSVYNNLKLCPDVATDLATLQHEIATQFAVPADAGYFNEKMKSLFLLQALSVQDKSSADIVFSSTTHEIMDMLGKTIRRPATQLALMSIGVSVDSERFSESDSNTLSSAIQYIKDALSAIPQHKNTQK